MHVTYNEVVNVASSSKMHPYDFRYVIVTLDPGDSSDNPASTKHLLYGPGTWLWEIHASGVSVREYRSPFSIPEELRDGAARIPA